MRSRLGFRAKRELLAQTAARYRAARHAQKSTILGEFAAARSVRELHPART